MLVATRLERECRLHTQPRSISPHTITCGTRFLPTTSMISTLLLFLGRATGDWSFSPFPWNYKYGLQAPEVVFWTVFSHSFNPWFPFQEKYYYFYDYCYSASFWVKNVEKLCINCLTLFHFVLFSCVSFKPRVIRYIGLSATHGPVLCVV